MSTRSYQPGTGGSPFGNAVANPQSSNYANDAKTGTATDTILLQKAIQRAIYEAVPEQYYALKILFEKTPMEYGADEFSFLEKSFGRTALEANSSPAAVAAVAGAEVTQSITMTADSTKRAVADDAIFYPDGTVGIVRSVTGNVFVIASQTGKGLPAVTTGDVFAIKSAVQGDGATGFSHFDRMETVTRYNYIELFLRARRWGKIELLKYKNMGNTNYLELDKKDTIDQLRTDLFVSIFNGIRGEVTLASGIQAKTMGGILPTMTAAGSMRGTPSIAALRSDFETLAFKTNYKKAGGTRFIYGCDEMLYELSKVYKDSLIRYAPNDKVAEMNLDMFKFGTMKFVPVPCELFKERSCFPASWSRKLLILDQESISPVKMKGLPMMDMGSTLDKGERGTREGFQDFYSEANLSLQFNNPLASFSLDIQ